MTYNPEPEIQRYLKRLSEAARGFPRGRRRELVAADVRRGSGDALQPPAAEMETRVPQRFYVRQQVGVDLVVRHGRPGGKESLIPQVVRHLLPLLVAGEPQDRSGRAR